MLIRQGEKIVFFGDSLTQRTDLNESEHPARRYSLDYAGSYVDILVKRLLIHFPQLEFTFYNRGVGGDTIRHLLERYSRDVAPLHPSMMILWIGQNDAKAPDPARFEQGLALPAGVVRAGSHSGGGALHLRPPQPRKDGCFGAGGQHFKAGERGEGASLHRRQVPDAGGDGA